MIILYKKLPKKTILKQAKEVKKAIAKWFKDNPKKKTCRAELWYGRASVIKPKSIDTDIDKAVEKAIGGDNA